MNRKTLYLNVAAAALLGTGTAQAASMSLDEAIRVQTESASAAIQNQLRADLHAMPLVLDVPGVKIGKVNLVNAESTGRNRAAAPLETTAIDISDALRSDLAAKALEVPGMFGVYRYVASSAATVTVVIAE